VGVYQPINNKAAWVVLDTVNNKLYHYKNSAWTLVGGDTTSLLNIADTTDMLSPYWRSGRFSGTLPVANGGTGSATQNFVDLSTTQTSIGGAKTFTSALIAASNVKIHRGLADDSESVAIGNLSLNSTTTGIKNTAIGERALQSMKTGQRNFAMGQFANYVDTAGSFNAAIGWGSLAQNLSGSNNVGVGYVTLYANTNGSSNTAVGYKAAGDLTNSNTTGSNNIFIGNSAVGESATESNRTWIGNTSTTSTWVGGNLLVGTRTNSGSRLVVKGVDGTSTNSALNVTNSSDASLLFVRNDGNVGIGTATPTARLSLGAASQGNRITFEDYSNIFSEYSSGDLWLSSNFYGNLGSSGYVTSTTASFGAAGIAVSGTAASLNGVIKFFVDNAASKTAGASFTPTERMRITSGGTIAIGATAITDPYTATGGGWQTVQFGKGGVLGAYRATDESMTGFNTYVATDGSNKAIISGVGGTAIRYYEDRITFNTISTSGTAQTQTERMRITSGGNVGIGVTPNTDIYSLNRGFQFPQGGSFLARNDIPLLFFGTNIITNETATVRQVNGRGTRLAVNAYNDLSLDFWVETVPYSTAGTSGSPVRKISLSEGGQFGIGDNIDPTQKLDVDGNARIRGNVSVGSATPTTSGSGITFPATQSASTNVNTLDDYEEGTWTPVYRGLGGSIGSTAYTIQRGRYTKIGRFCHASGEIYLTNKGSWSSGVEIAGLPFNTTAAESAFGFIILGSVDLDAGVKYCQFRGTGASNNQAYIDTILDNADRVILYTTAINNNSTFEFSFIYTVN
jgi:hypothetical protein